MADSDGSVALTATQFERLVGMLAENRIDFRRALGEFREESQGRYQELKQHLTLIQSSQSVIEEDLSRIQRTQREHGALLIRHDEAFDGLTKLASTNFDLLESVQKHIHGESGSIAHGEESQGTIPQ